MKAKKISFIGKLASKILKKKGFFNILWKVAKKSGKKAFKTMANAEKKCPGITVAVGTAIGSIIGAFAQARAARHPVVNHMAVVEIGDGYFDVASWPGLYKIHMDDLSPVSMKRIIYQLKAVRAHIAELDGSQLMDVRIVADSDSSAVDIVKFQKLLRAEGFPNIQIDYKGNLKKDYKKETAKQTTTA